MSYEYTVNRASDGDNATLSLDGPPPDYENTHHWQAWLNAQAAIVHAALLHLPGGTYDRLLGLMLARTTSQYRVKHKEVADA